MTQWPGHEFDGDIADVRLFERVLNEAEVRGIREAEQGGAGLAVATPAAAVTWPALPRPEGGRRPVLCIDCAPGRPITLSWHAASGHVYQVQWSSAMPPSETGWRDLGPSVQGDGRLHRLDDGSRDPSRFYRVTATPGPAD
jgi:hypothetical protein